MPLITRCTLHVAHYTSHLTRSTLHVAHYTLHITPCTLQLAHYALHNTRCTIHATHYRLRITRFTLHVAQYTSHISGCALHIAHQWSTKMFAACRRSFFCLQILSIWKAYRDENGSLSVGLKVCRAYERSEPHSRSECNSSWGVWGAL